MGLWVETPEAYPFLEELKCPRHWAKGAALSGSFPEDQKEDQRFLKASHMVQKTPGGGKKRGLEQWHMGWPPSLLWDGTQVVILGLA